MGGRRRLAGRKAESCGTLASGGGLGGRTQGHGHTRGAPSPTPEVPVLPPPRASFGSPRVGSPPPPPPPNSEPLQPGERGAVVAGAVVVGHLRRGQRTLGEEGGETPRQLPAGLLAAAAAAPPGDRLPAAGVERAHPLGGRLFGGAAGPGGAPGRLGRLICFCRYFRWFTFRLDFTGLSSASLMLLEAESMKLSRSLVASLKSPASPPPPPPSAGLRRAGGRTAAGKRRRAGEEEGSGAGLAPALPASPPGNRGPGRAGCTHPPGWGHRQRRRGGTSITPGTGTHTPRDGYTHPSGQVHTPRDGYTHPRTG
uniref:Uncharacterized protein n=1 Tax=Calidris pygmaea TaxID=425635 RepID=A0A8C3JSU2_9CHAR